MPQDSYRERLEQLKRMTKKGSPTHQTQQNINLQKLNEELEEENRKLKELARDQKKLIDKLHDQIKQAITILRS